VVQAAHRIGSRTLKNNVLMAIAAASFVAIFALNVPFPIIVLAAACVGLVGGRLSPVAFSASGGHTSTQASFGLALIDDDTLTPPHALFTWKRLMNVLLAGAVLWALPMAFLVMQHGWHDTLTQMRVGSSPKPRCSHLAVLMQCFLMFTKAQSNSLAG